MKLKHLIWITVAWLFLAIGAGAIGTWYIVDQDGRGPRAMKRVERLGSTTGLVAAVGCGVIWLPYAYRVGKKRRQALQEKRKK